MPGFKDTFQPAYTFDQLTAPFPFPADPNSNLWKLAHRVVSLNIGEGQELDEEMAGKLLRSCEEDDQKWEEEKHKRSPRL